MIDYIIFLWIWLIGVAPFFEVVAGLHICSFDMVGGQPAHLS